ncbi:hypothetical protein HDV00_011030 [Rhizophlyctis rosea]|nr:hypothetical protein HDV00_011030 [Rhizophlyctis rosea]
MVMMRCGSGEGVGGAPDRDGVAEEGRLDLEVQRHWGSRFLGNSDPSRSSFDAPFINNSPLINSPTMASFPSTSELSPDIQLSPELQELPADIQSLLRSLPFFRSRLTPRFASQQSLSGIPQLSSSVSSAQLTNIGPPPGIEAFLTDVAKVMHLRHMNAGDVILKEGDAAKAMFFVVKGCVKVISEDGEINYAELGPGNFFGEIGILFSMNRTATVTAKTKCLLAVITAEELRTKSEAHPEIREMLEREAQDRFEQLEREMMRAGKKRTYDTPEELKKELSSAQGSFRDITLSRLHAKKSFEQPPELPSPSSEMPLEDQLPSNISIPLPTGTASEDFTTAALTITANATPPPSSIHTQSPNFGSYTPLSPASPASPASPLIPQQQSLPEAISAPLLNSNVATLQAKYGGRRRASVAVWSDDRLMQFAQTMSEKGDVPARDRHSANVTSQLSSSYVSDSLPHAPPVNPEDEKGFGVLGRDAIMRVLRYLDFRQRMRVRLASMVLLRGMLQVDSRLVSDVDLSLWHKRIDDKIVANVACFVGGTVRKLNLKGCWQVTDKGLSTLGAYCPNLEVLCLASVWDITDAGLADLVRMCRNLREVDLSNCRKLGDAGVMSLVEGAENLETLSVSYCKNLTDGVMDNAGWKRVRKVNFQRCTGIFDGGFEKWRNFVGGEADGNGEEGEAGMEVDQDSPHLGNVEAEEVQVFDIEDTDINLNSGEEGSSSSLTWTSQPDGEPGSRPHFLSAGYRYSPDEDIAAVDTEEAYSASESDNSETRDLFPSYVPFNSRGFAMTELILSDCSFLTDATVASIAASCPNLTALSLSFCCALTEAFASPLATGCRWLKILDLSFCGAAVTDESIEILVTPPSPIPGIDVTHYHSAIINLQPRNPTNSTAQYSLNQTLQRLSIRGCVQVTDEGIQILERWCKRLKMINVSQCRGVDLEGVKRKGWRLLTCQGLLEVEDEDEVVGRGLKEDGRKKERSRASTA